MGIVILAVFAVLVLGESAFAWGLMTHVELTESVLTQASVLAAGIGSLLIRYRKDFLLGNLLADVMIGKKLSLRRRHTHHWTGGLRLMENAHDDQTRAFAYGFLTHLAADTVAHNDFIPQQIIRTGSTISIGHLYWELMADQYTHPATRKKIRKILAEPSEVHEQLLEDHLYPQMKWYGLNRSIFTNINRLTYGRRFNMAVKLCHELSFFPLQKEEILSYQGRAIDRMIDVLKNGRKSLLLKEDPNGIQALSDIREKRRAM
jgi:hypothetical protein